MKYVFILSLGLFLESCNSIETPSTNASGTPRTMLSVESNPDPRVAIIRQQHEQLVAQQKDYSKQLNALTGYEKLTPERVKESEEYFADYVQKSQANLTDLDQLDVSKSKDPAQISLIGELAEKEKSLLERATKRLANIHNEHYLPK
ncbi:MULTISPECIES: hypothetical protein [unclassified Hymenobacter]|nr:MULTISPECIES: hypothetical protein [unclassified Hymenobacter]